MAKWTVEWLKLPDGTIPANCRMRDDLADVHEARDRQGETLYRLFVYWDKRQRTLVLLDGRTKPNGTALDKSEYEEIERLADIVKAADPKDPPFASADDFARILVDLPLGE